MANINELNGYMLEDTQARTDISAINDKIPSNASSNNKLATISDVSAAYKPKGNATLATLPSLTVEHLNWVYNMTEDFTTTSDFAEGAGKEVEAGNEVGIIDISTTSTPNYKYTVLGGFVDTSSLQPRTLDTPITVDGTQKTTVETALSAINTLAANVKSAVGTLSSLTTTVKTNIVAAINELVTNITSRVDWSSYAVTGVHNFANFVQDKGVNTSGEVVDTPGRIATVNPIPIESGKQYKVVTTATSAPSFIYAVWNGSTLVRREAGVNPNTILDTSGGDKLYVCAYRSESITVSDAKAMVIFANDSDTSYRDFVMTNEELTNKMFPRSEQAVLGARNIWDDTLVLNPNSSGVVTKTSNGYTIQTNTTNNSGAQFGTSAVRGKYSAYGNITVTFEYKSDVACAGYIGQSDVTLATDWTKVSYTVNGSTMGAICFYNRDTTKTPLIEMRNMMITLATDTDPTYVHPTMTNQQLSEAVAYSESACTDIVEGATVEGDVNKICKFGKVVFMTLQLQGVTSNAWSDIFSIPDGYRPKETLMVMAWSNNSNGFMPISIGASGGVSPLSSLTSNKVRVSASWITA